LIALTGGGWRDEIWRRLLRNVGYLVGGNAAASAIGLVSLALTARALGPEGLGVLALIEAYSRLIDRLCRLEPWQALIKYGAHALEDERFGHFRQLLKFGVLLDGAGALLATVIAVAGVYLVGPWFGWSAQTMEMAAVYSLGILFNLSATPTAIMRLFDRFALFAWLDVAVAGLRLVLVALAWAAGAGLWTFLLLGLGLGILRPAVLFALAWRELYRRGYADCLRQPMRGLTRNFAGLWDFVWWLNLSILIRKSTRELDTLLVGTLLDPTAVGLYHVAKRLGDAALKVGVPIQQAIFPDVARLWARRQTDRMRQTVRRVNLASGALAAAGLVLVALSVDRVLVLAVGEAFAGARGALLLQMAAVTLALGGISLRPALLSMGLQRPLLHAVVVASVAFYACLLIAVPMLGVIGASLAHLVFNGVWLAICTGVFESTLQRPSPAVDLAPEAGGEP
jgi:O-antigen/teichoic acid export membrane protein